MTIADKHIVEAYAAIFEGLTPMNKLELISRLSKSLMSDQQKSDKNFFKSFGAFDSSKTPEEIIGEIKKGRSFRDKDITL